MLETKCVGDIFSILVTVLVVFVINILSLLSYAPGTNIHKMSPTPGNSHQRRITNIHMSPTSTCRHHLCSQFRSFVTQNQIRQSIYFNFSQHSFWWNAKLFFAEIFVDNIKRYSKSVLIFRKRWLDDLVGSIFQLPNLRWYRTENRFLSSSICWK